MKQYKVSIAKTSRKFGKLKQIHVRQKGFGLLESMGALALFAMLTMSLVMFNSNNMRRKDAKILAHQTEVFATTYARYMHIKESDLLVQASINPVILSPQSIQASWPVDLATSNMYHQTPCVTIVANKTTSNLEAVMYYIGGNSDMSGNKLDIVRRGAVILGSKGGILHNDAIMGNSGWQVISGSPFLSNFGQCGGNLSNNSLAVNIDLLPEWNQNAHPTNVLLRGTDRAQGQLSLPGHIKNANTLMFNIIFATNKGVIFDNSNPVNPTKLSILYNGQGSGTPTLGLGNNTISTIIGDTFKPNLQFKAGQACLAQEAGKMVIDQGLNNSASQYLARSTLICTQNDMLCGAGNYCYLPTITNNVVFKNSTNGLQNANGQFICPAEVPFAKTYTLSSPWGYAYVFFNRGPNAIRNGINVIMGYTNGGSSGWTPWTCPNCDQYFMTDFNNARDRSQLLGVDLATVAGPDVGTITSSSGTVASMIGNIGQYSVVVGYTVQGPSLSCNNICSSLGNLLYVGNHWQVLGTQRMARSHQGIIIQNQNMGCACERTDFSGANPDNYTGVAAVIGDFTSKIIAVTCSNSPVYKG